MLLIFYYLLLVVYDKISILATFQWKWLYNIPIVKLLIYLLYIPDSRLRLHCLTLHISSIRNVYGNECVLTSGGGVIYDGRYYRSGLVNHFVPTKCLRNLPNCCSNDFKSCDT